MKFTVIGGDMRLAKLAEMLAADGHEVCTYALEKQMIEGARHESVAKNALKNAECVILPLPMTLRDEVLNTPLSSGIHTLREILSVASPDQIMCGGKIGQSTVDTASEYGIKIIDYIEREEMAVANAGLAAEGAIKIMTEETAFALTGASCLVIGYGRIGKLLCKKLAALGVNVTAAARNVSDLAWIRAYGYGVANTTKLDGTLSGYDIVINTVPARVLSERRLKELKEGCLCLDLASKPGGMDFTAASRLGVQAVWALSLPGEVAPITSGEIIKETVYNIINEKK